MKTSVFVSVLVLGLFFPREKPFEVEVLRNEYVERVGGNSEARSDTPTDKVWVDAYDVTLKEDTWVVENCLGKGFLLELRFSNIPKELKTIDLHVKFPPMKLPSGAIKSEIKRKEELYVEGGYAYFDYTYYFDEEYERGLGFWEFDLRYKELKIFEGKFEVVQCKSE